MSNLFYNSLKISGTKESVERVKNRILVTEDYIKELEKRNDGVDVDFQIRIPEIGELSYNRLIPKPINIYSGILSNFEEETYGEENCWYVWSCNHWGTKWDAYEQRIEMLSNGILVISFTSAGNPPFYYLKKLAQVCKEEGCSMNGEFLCECISDIAGRYYINENNDFFIEFVDDESIL